MLSKKAQRINNQNNFFYLTLALVFLLISASLDKVITSGFLQYILEVFTFITFGICLLSLRFDKNWFRFLLLLVVAWLIAVITRTVLGIEEIEIIMLLLMFTFFYGTFCSIMRQILFTGSITANKIIGSMALFLLLGLMWAIGYLILIHFLPGSFQGINKGPWHENFADAAYFSFVTLTTLGYGDILPILPIAKVLAYLEAIVGVFYMAIVVSSLVSSSREQYFIEHVDD
ncbi:potassium channel family protein [Photobacterium carnosum]|uniref:Transporter n=1 Tax=Photobacterium carnosum TaxID=2023717 RepID=A0A2N4UTM7_9GAMM|nr:potassium channel family protein [Photobacterium carnosum]KAE8178340.1 transporter [Photobacterium carnosum]MCD9496073.1 two pore domain potassium channel family protein [Photobacterium carnosum]MCD9498512.1 two pore domain potassium channel family protein [Photobacterium carnosum]MCD9514509.1 two pore domain potassium channel family protein [Photobacterium carnosum]MCD9523594.1 two pore domain potassium channel family protein [Photobacterium carnosum]